MEESRTAAGAVFATTHWSIVLSAADTSAPDAQESLEKLCRTYWYPLYAYVRRKGHSIHDAQDLTQEFFARLLKDKLVSQFRGEGKFRSFLLASLQNYLSGEFDRRHSLKRGGNIKFVPWDFEACENLYRSETHEALTAEKIFDARWAVTLLHEALRLLREEYVVQGKSAVEETLEPFLDPATSRKLPSYPEIAEKLHVSLGGVKTLIHRLRNRYSELLRAEVARTVTNPEAVDEEIHALCEALIAAEGRISP